MPPDMECTWWPDGWPTWLGGTATEWLHCCITHDLGGSLGELGACVWQSSPTMAVVMVAGLAMFGGVYAFSQRVQARLKQG